MAALDSVKLPAEPADLLSSDGEDDETSWLIIVLLFGATLFIGLSTAVAFCLRVRELRAKARTDLRLDPDGVTPLSVQLLPAPNAL